MKNLLIAFLLISSFQMFSQEINYEKGKFYVNGSQISSRDAREKIKSNPIALQIFKQAKSKQSNGGFLLGLGTAVLISDLVKGLVSDEVYPGTGTYIGAGLLVVSIPVIAGNKKKMKRAITMYNEGLKSTGEQNNFELNVLNNQNGIGFQLRF